MKKTITLLAFLFVAITNAQNWDKEKITGNGNLELVS